MKVSKINFKIYFFLKSRRRKNENLDLFSIISKNNNDNNKTIQMWDTATNATQDHLSVEKWKWK